MRIAYARVSTDKQELDRQLQALEAVGYDRLITEKVTGTKRDRAGLNQLMDMVREGDTVIVESISRLGRRTLDVLHIVEDLRNMGVELISLKESIDSSTPTGQAMLSMMAVIAQLERDLTVQRVNEGVAAAKARGVKMGRPFTPKQKVKDALDLYDGGNHSVKDIVRLTGISQGTLYKYLNNRKEYEAISKQE